MCVCAPTPRVQLSKAEVRAMFREMGCQINNEELEELMQTVGGADKLVQFDEFTSVRACHCAPTSQALARDLVHARTSRALARVVCAAGAQLPG
ncbi:hypothetical protein EON67_10090 [archaeon]|nr:MAG: hypothetical protein EON67_10090 [archaeon]